MMQIPAAIKRQGGISDAALSLLARRTEKDIG